MIWQRSMDVSVLGQDVQKIVNHIDIISPMLYPSHFGKDFDGIPNPADEPYYFVREGSGSRALWETGWLSGPGCSRSP